MTDAVTLARVPIAIALLASHRRPRLALVWYLLGVGTDLVDGPLARRLGTSSVRGARLDSAADAVFVAASTVVVARTIEPPHRRLVVGGAVVVAAIRAATLVVTRQRFGTCSIVHTRLNKATGLALAGIAAVAMARGRMPLGALAAAGVLGGLSAVEELVIVATATEYDVDRTSVLAR